MFPHGNWRDPILINTIGHTAGVLLFGVIIILLIRDWRMHGTRQLKLSLIAALLALGWNIGSLIALALAGSEFASGRNHYYRQLFPIEPAPGRSPSSCPPRTTTVHRGCRLCRQRLCDHVALQ